MQFFFWILTFFYYFWPYPPSKFNLNLHPESSSIFKKSCIILILTRFHFFLLVLSKNQKTSVKHMWISIKLCAVKLSEKLLVQVVSCVLIYQNFWYHMYGNIPCMFDNWANPVDHLLLLKSSVKTRRSNIICNGIVFIKKKRWAPIQSH